MGNASDVWDRVRSGRHTVVVGLSLPEPPQDMRVVRVSCDVPLTTLGPLLEARERVERVLGTEAPLVEMARARVLTGLRRHLLGDLTSVASDGTLVDVFNRFASLGPAALELDAAEAADPASLDMLRHILGRPGWLRLPLVITLRAEPTSASAAALVEAVRAASGDDAVLRVPAPAAPRAQPPLLPAEPPLDPRALPADVVRVLRALAIAGSGCEASILASVLEMSEIAVLDALQRASDAGVRVEDRGEGRFHLPEPTVDALRVSILPSLAAALHRRVAEILARERPAPAAAPPPTLELASDDIARPGNAWDVLQAPPPPTLRLPHIDDALPASFQGAAAPAGTSFVAEGVPGAAAPAGTSARPSPGGAPQGAAAPAAARLESAMAASAEPAAVAPLAPAAAPEKAAAAPAAVAGPVEAAAAPAAVAGPVEAAAAPAAVAGPAEAAVAPLAPAAAPEKAAVASPAAAPAVPPGAAVFEGGPTARPGERLRRAADDARAATEAQEAAERAAREAREAHDRAAGEARAARDAQEAAERAAREAREAHDRAVEEAIARAVLQAEEHAAREAEERAAEGAARRAAAEAARRAAEQAEETARTAAREAEERAAEEARRAADEAAARAAEEATAHAAEEARRAHAARVEEEAAARRAAAEIAEQVVEGAQREIEEDGPRAPEYAKPFTGEVRPRGAVRPAKWLSPLASEPEAAGRTQRPAGPERRPRGARVDDAARAARHLAAAGDAEAAVERYFDAMQRAAAAAAYPQAVAHAQAALGLLDRLPATDARRLQRVQLLLEAGRVLWHGAGPDESFTLQGSLRVLEAARASLHAGDPPELIAELAVTIAGALHEVGDLASLTRALDELANASRALADAGQPQAAARLFNDQAGVYIRLGDPVRAAHLLTESRKIFEPTSKTDPIAAIEMAETDHLFARLLLHVPARPGREDDALSLGLDHALAAERVFRRLGAPREVGRVLETMGRLELRKGRLERATERLTAAIQIQESMGDVMGLAASTAALADVLAAGGHLQEALNLLADSIVLNFEKGSPLGIAHNRRSLEALAASAGRGEGTADLLAAVKERLTAAEHALGSIPIPGTSA